MGWIRTVFGGAWDAAGVVDDWWGRAKVLGAAVLCLGGVFLLLGIFNGVLIVVGFACILIGGVTLVVTWRKGQQPSEPEATGLLTDTMKQLRSEFQHLADSEKNEAANQEINQEIRATATSLMPDLRRVRSLIRRGEDLRRKEIGEELDPLTKKYRPDRAFQQAMSGIVRAAEMFGPKDVNAWAEDVARFIHEKHPEYADRILKKHVGNVSSAEVVAAIDKNLDVLREIEGRLQAPTPTPDLDVVIEHEGWDAFQYQAHILEMRVSVTNNTKARKRIIGFQLETRGAAKASMNIDVRREVERRKNNHPRLDHQTIIEPGATVTGWLVYQWDWPANGRPEYTLKIKDELNVEHQARRKDGE